MQLQDITLGRYIAGNSILHRLDPRCKLICALMLMIAVFTISLLPRIVIFTSAVVMLFPLARIPLRFLWDNLRLFLWLYIITFAIHLFFHPGQALIRLPIVGWEITPQGINAGFLFTLRIVVLVTLSMLFMAVTTPQDLTDGIEKLLKPLKKLNLPVSEGALMISIALRFVPILMQEALKIQKAQLARGADLEGSWYMRLKKSLPMILPLFSGALKRADDLALALEARGYRGGNGRTNLVVLSLSRNDVVAFLATASLIVMFLIA